MINPPQGGPRRVTPPAESDIGTFRAEFLRNTQEIWNLQRRVERIELILANLAREDDAHEDRPEAVVDAGH